MRIRALALCAALLAAIQIPYARAQQHFERSVPLGSATALRLNITGDVRIVPTSTTAVAIHGTSYPGMPAMQVRSSRQGARLTLSMTGPARDLFPFSASGHAYEIEYPQNVPLEVRDFGGSVAIEHPAHSVSVYAEKGAIAITDPAAAVTADADDGDLTVTGARSTLILSTGTGAVHASLTSGWSGSFIRLESSDGALNLSVPQAFRGRFDLTSEQGAVHNAVPSGNGPVVFMLTERGDVSISRQP